MTGADPFSEASRREAHLALVFANSLKAPTRARAAERDPAWRARAACVDADPADFYAADGSAGQRRALATCAGCPVKTECCEYAEALEDPHGVWGGQRPQDRLGGRRGAQLLRQQATNDRKADRRREGVTA